MTNSHHSIEEARDRSALYALGALPGDEARAFEGHLRDGCAICSAEVEAFTAVATDLATAPTPQRPTAQLRTRVLERVAREGAGAQEPLVTVEGLLFARTTRLTWQDTNVPGIESKTLFKDPARGYGTQLVRMGPGTTYPSHRHVDLEELYLLEGDLLVSGVLMRAGDYCRAEPGTVHSDISTRGGCLFISMASERDELLA